MSRLSIHAALFIAALCHLPAPVAADARVISTEEQGAWNAVGRLNKAGFDTLQGCTATLVAPDLILTAGHCVPAPGGDLTDYRFVAGWNRGDYAAVSDIHEVYLHPDNIPGPLSFGSVFADVALMRLVTPLDIQPLALGPMPEDHLPIAFLAYRNDTPHAPTLRVGCAHRLFRAHVVTVDCPVVAGNSGAPLLELTPDGPRVISVISAQWGSGALAVRPQDWMRDYLTHVPSSNSQ